MARFRGRDTKFRVTRPHPLSRQLRTDSRGQQGLAAMRTARFVER